MDEAIKPLITFCINSVAESVIIATGELGEAPNAPDSAFAGEPEFFEPLVIEAEVEEPKQLEETPKEDSMAQLNIAVEPDMTSCKQAATPGSAHLDLKFYHSSLW